MEVFAQYFARFSLLVFNIGLFVGMIYYAVLGTIRSMMNTDYRKEMKIRELIDHLNDRKLSSARIARGYCVLFLISWLVFTIFLFIKFEFKNPF